MGNGQGVPCRVDAAFASPSSHFLNFPSPLFCFSPTPIYFSSLCFLLLLLSSFRCLSLSLCCCPYSLKILWRQFFPLFQNVLIFSSVSYSISSWTKKMSRKRRVNLTFSNFLKLLFESRKKVQVISYFYLNSFPIQIVSIRNVRRFRGIQSWSWIIQIYIKNAELLEQPVHFIENIGRTLGNGNKYHPFLSFLLKGHAGKKTDFFFPNYKS